MAALGKGVVEIIPRMIGETEKRAGLGRPASPNAPPGAPLSNAK